MSEELSSKKKLQWLALSNAVKSLSSVQDEIELLKEIFPVFSIFQNHLEKGFDYNNDGNKENLDSYEDFDNYLAEGSNSIGFSESEADAFIEKIKQNFTDEDESGSSFDEFKDFIINDIDSFEEIKSAFDTNTSFEGNRTISNGKSAAGVRFHETKGATRNGVPVPAGTTEIYGNEIHFSQSNEPSDEEDTGTISFDNISATDNLPIMSQVVTISADIINTKDEDETVAATFIEDGTKIDTKTVRVRANSSQSVSFDVVYNNIESHEYRIKNTESVNIRWQTTTL